MEHFNKLAHNTTLIIIKLLEENGYIHVDRIKSSEENKNLDLISSIRLTLIEDRINIPSINTSIYCSYGKSIISYNNPNSIFKNIISGNKSNILAGDQAYQGPVRINLEHADPECFDKMIKVINEIKENHDYQQQNDNIYN